MGNMMAINGSPRGPKSHSKQLTDLFQKYWGGDLDQYMVTAQKHGEICPKLGDYQHILLVFPLYADGLPVTLMHFLREWENHVGKEKPTVHVMINCGFLEPEQNLVAVDMIRLFCKQNGYPYGMTLCIGSGEAILSTPFAGLVKHKIKKMVKGIRQGKRELLKVTMPIAAKLFCKAAARYWLGLGEQNNIGRQQMETMKIE